MNISEKRCRFTFSNIIVVLTSPYTSVYSYIFVYQQFTYVGVLMLIWIVYTIPYQLGCVTRSMIVLNISQTRGFLVLFHLKIVC